jgi:hypothetical protein
MSATKEWKFKALMPTVTGIVFEYSDCGTMELTYHDHLRFSVVGNDIFPKTGPMTCWEIREHYGTCCEADDPEYFRKEFLEEYHPFVHMYVELPGKCISFIEWLKELGDVEEDADDDKWPE